MENTTKLEIIINTLIGQIESKFIKNPNHDKFYLETRAIKSTDEAKKLINHFKDLNFYMSIQEQRDSSFLIIGDNSFEVNRNIQNQEMNKLFIRDFNKEPLKALVGFVAYDGNGYSKDAIPDFNDLTDEEIEKLYVMAGSSKKR